MNDGSRHSSEADHATPKRPVATENDSVGMVSTLLAGPLVWGLIGVGADALFDTGRLFLAVGIAVGFGLSFYIMFVRYGRP
jgi:F0F1-type ATP synthase assembly protein I